MAITVKIEEKQDKEITFPCLMRHKETVLTVLFHDSRTGIVLSPGPGWDIGEYRKDWSLHNQSSHWELSPPITIANA